MVGERVPMLVDDSSVAIAISFVLFLILFLFVGAIASRFNTSSESDYLLGGKTYNKWMVGLSMGASGNSGFILVASVGLGYTQGLAAFMYVGGFFVGEYLFWTLIAGKVSRRNEFYQSDSVSELLSRLRGGGYSLLLRSSTAILTVVFVGVYLVAQLVASAKILDSLFGISISTGVLVTTVLILGYCTTGGLRASIWTDMVQAALIVLLTVTVTILALGEVGYPMDVWAQLRAVDPSLLSASPYDGWGKTIAYFIGCVFLGFGFCLSQPHLIVRLMAGRNQGEVEGAKWVYFSFLYLTWGAMTLFGVLIRLAYPEIEDPEQGLPVFVSDHFPPLLIGVALAGMFSTIASTADSQLLACSSALSRDLIPRVGEKLTRLFGTWWLYTATLGVGIVAMVVAQAEVASVFDLAIFASATLSATIGMAMLVRVSSLPYIPHRLFLCMAGGLAAALLWRYFGYHHVMSDAAPGLTLAFLSYYLWCRASGECYGSASLPH
ncbi:hypothetical protein MRY87_11845 [bacterium]|nr:hypothetical protein [bacterium]